jgi:hypothetical protein
MSSNPAPLARPLTLIAAIAGVAITGMMVPRAYSQPPQEPAAQQHVDARAGRVVEISPRVGPPGTEVTLRASSMPSLTPVQLAIGATRSGFEAIALGFTTIDGDLEAVVTVPDWAKPEQTHRFIAFNLYFSSILAESPIFHVTDAAGRVVREGTVGSAGAACPTLEGDDGERYRLTGDTGDLRVGEHVRLQGPLSENDAGCGEELWFDLEVASGR